MSYNVWSRYLIEAKWSICGPVNKVFVRLNNCLSPDRRQATCEQKLIHIDLSPMLQFCLVSMCFPRTWLYKQAIDKNNEFQFRVDNWLLVSPTPRSFVYQNVHTFDVFKRIISKTGGILLMYHLLGKITKHTSSYTDARCVITTLYMIVHKYDETLTLPSQQNLIV